jgi:lipopolysaccharide export system protein LptA
MRRAGRHAWLAALLAPALALAGEPPAPAVPAVTDPPVRIRSERLSVLQREGRAVFSGQVETVQGELRIGCDELEVRYARAPKGAPDNAPAAQEVERMWFRGHVDITQAATQGRSARHGRCREAEYDRVAQRIVCTGDPWVEEGPNRIEGERILYLLGRDEVQVVRPRAVLELPPPRPAKPGGAGKAGR